MSNFKKLIIKLLLLGMMVSFCQYFLTYDLLEIDDPRLKNYVFRFEVFTRLKTFLKKKKDIIYFGDSTLYTVGRGDKDKRDLGRMAADMLPQYSMGEISHAAYHIELYLEYCRYIVKQKYHPSIIIIPINMRSFSPDWDMRPQYQFEREKIILKGGLLKHLVLVFYKPLRVFKYDFYTLTREEFLNTPVFNGTRRVGVISDFNHKGYLKHSESNMKNKILLFYMYSLTRQHRKVKSLGETVRILSRNNIRALFYITPIDYETGEKYFPGQFTQRLKENVQLIRSVLETEGVDVLDLSTTLPAEVFTWGLYPNEYLKTKGRMYTAKRIRDLIVSSNSHRSKEFFP
jgi:hypothetical protein